MEIAYSLAISYLLLGAAIGLVSWYAVSRLTQGDALKEAGPKIILAALVLSVVGIGFATGHLGKMGRFLNMLSNPASWLSREAFFVGLFTLCIVIYYVLLQKSGVEKVRNYNYLLYIAVLAGLCTLISMGMIYASVKAVPAWNTTMIVLLDILSAGVLGGFLFLVLGGKTMPHSLLKSLSAAMLSVLIIALVVNIAYDVQVEMALAALAAQGATVPSVWLGTLLRLLVGLIVPAYLVYKVLAAEPRKQLSAFSVALVCVVIGEAAARVMHFVVAVKGPFI